MVERTQELLSKARRIRLLILDVDGVLTDGRLHYGAAGEELKTFHVRDGLGIRLLQANGIEVAVITARHSAPLSRRMSDLGIRRFFPGSDNKLEAYESLIEEMQVSDEAVACVGDDIIDLPMLRHAGLACTVADGHCLVKRAVHCVAEAAGGTGAVREIADLLLEAQCGLETSCERFLEVVRQPGGPWEDLLR